MFSNETQEKPPVPRRSKYDIFSSPGAEQNSAVIQENKTGTLASIAIATVGNLFATPQGKDFTSANGTEQKAMNYGTFPPRK